MAGALIRFWDHHSHVREGQSWLEAALASSGDLPPAPRAKALWGAGVLAIGTGDYERAERWLSEGVALAREAGDRYVLGFLQGELGTVALHDGDLERATELHEEGLDRCGWSATTTGSRRCLATWDSARRCGATTSRRWPGARRVWRSTEGSAA